MGPHPYSSFKALLSSLDQKGLFRITPGLERIATVLAKLKLKRLPFPVIQVIGSNGKGSTSTMLSSLAFARGLRAGLYTSPHFVSVTERIRINTTPLSEKKWLQLAATLNQAGGETLSYFEWLTALAALAFKSVQTDMAIFEAGLGGTWDATTALDPDIIIYTPIDLDHENILGKNLTAIATDKAGAIRNGAHVISAPQHPEVKEILTRIAQQQSSTITFCSTPLPDSVELALNGPHQRMNAAVALCVWRAITKEFFDQSGKTYKIQQSACSATDKPAITLQKHTEANATVVLEQELKGFANAWLPGRVQQIKTANHSTLSSTPLAVFESIMLDGAHNPHSLAALVSSLRGQQKLPHILMFACLQDKDIERIFPFIQLMQPHTIIVPPLKDNPRAFAPELLAAFLSSKIDTPIYSTLSLMEALDKAKEVIMQSPPPPQKIPLLVTGSLYLLGDVFSLFPALLSPPSTNTP